MSKKLFLKSIHLPRLTLKMGGVYLDYPKSMNWNTYFKWSWFFYFNMFTLNSDILGEMVWFFNGARSGTNLVELTFNAPCLVFSILGSCKMYYLFRNKDVVTDLMTKLHDMYPDDGMPDGIKEITKDSTSFLSPIVTITFYLNCVLVWLFNLFPLAHIVKKYMATGEVELLLPYLIAYPFNQFDVRIWPIIYVRQMWDGIFTAIGIVGPDTLYYACCSHIRMHFRILQYRLENSVTQTIKPGLKNNLRLANQPYADELRNSKIDNAKLRKNLVYLVQKHQELIELVKQLEQLYSMSTLINFVSSSVLICLTGFNVLAVDKSKLPVFAVFLTSCLSQIFVFCLFGDMIKESSMQVSNSIYYSHWYLVDLDIRKMMLFSLLRAQKACKLTALNFADVNLHAFTRIMSTSWSYFALLNTAYNRNQK